MKLKLVHAIALVGASVTLLAASASPALATECANILGAGSSLQNNAQTKVWIPGFTKTEGWWLFLCPNKPEITYDSTSSGKGKEKWGYKTGTLDEGATGENIPAFVGTDIAPNKEQIENMGKAGEQSTFAKGVMAVPVTQSAVSVLVSLPQSCHPKSGKKFAEVSLAALTKEWLTGGLSFVTYVENVEGTGCSALPNVKVRSSGSGTTAGFKRYFDTDSGEAAPWMKITLTPLESEEVKWPLELEDSGHYQPCCEKGSQLASLVLTDAGSTGYADLSDARAQGFAPGDEWVQHTNGSGETFLSAIAEIITTNPSKEAVSPEEAEGGSNCQKAKYKGETTLLVAPGEDWSEAKQVNTNENEAYPICTLTFDLAWNKYNTMKLELVAHGYGTEAESIGLTVRHYLHKIVLKGFGQSEALTLQHFGELPKEIREKAENATNEENILK
jgi:ABC-type phosphate transport system substrate-binding protein